MKKVFLVLSLLSGAILLNAEQMQFVTTLSSPLGTFAQLETADYGAVASVPLVNFCNSRASVGAVRLKGANAYLQTLNLKNGTTLGGNAPEFRIAAGLNVNNGATVEGGRLVSNAATVSGASSAKSKVEEVLYANSIKVKGAKTSALTIPGQVQTGGAGDGTELKWSNIYTKDYKCTNGTCSEAGGAYTSYLLKSVSAPEPEGCNLTWEDCITDTEWRDFDKENCRCVDSYRLQYRSMTFAATGYECLGKNKFSVAKPNSTPGLYPDLSKAKKLYSLDQSPFDSNSWYGLQGKTPRDLIYQCVFTKNVKIKKISCALNDAACIETVCKESSENTVFLREDKSGTSYFTNNVTQVYGLQPQSIYGGDSGQYYCWNELKGPSLTSGAKSMRPCLGFGYMKFWVCDKNGKMDFSMFADDAQSSWSPNTSFQALP